MPTTRTAVDRRDAAAQSRAYATDARVANGPGDAHDCRRIAARRIAGLPNHKHPSHHSRRFRLPIAASKRSDTHQRNHERRGRASRGSGMVG